MTDNPRRGADLSIPTLPNLREVEVREAGPGSDESTDIVVRSDVQQDLTSPTVPSFAVPAASQPEARPGVPAVSVVDSLISESLRPAGLPSLPTLSSLLVTPPPAQEPAREPLRSLADQIPPSFRELPAASPTEVKPRRSGLWVGFICGVVVASAAIAVGLRLFLH